MTKKESKEPNFIKLHNHILKITQVASRCVLVDGSPEMVYVTLTDKILYVFMKSRYDYFTKVRGGNYFESYQQIADAVGVDKKSVARFVHKWKSHGFIDYFNGGGNRLNYTRFDYLFGEYVAPTTIVDEVPEYLQSVPDDDSGYIPEFSGYDYEYESRVGLI